MLNGLNILIGEVNLHIYYKKHIAVFWGGKELVFITVSQLNYLMYIRSAKVWKQ